MERLAGLMLSLSLAGLLSACSPKGQPLAAIAVNAQGAPIAVVAPCEGDGIVSISVFENDQGGELRWRVAGTTQPLGAGEVKFFTVPSGWSVTDESLRGLTGDHAYALSVGRSSGRSIDSVTFRLSDLASLSFDQVWGCRHAGDAAPQMVSRADFSEEAASSCN